MMLVMAVWVLILIGVGAVCYLIDYALNAYLDDRFKNKEEEHGED